MKKVLITGFKPFLNQAINPSEMILRALEAKVEEFKTAGIELHFEVLPVEFGGSFKELKSKGPFDRILMLGQARGRSKVSLERVALNWRESKNPDNANVIAKTGPIVLGGEPAFFNKLPLEQWHQELQNQKFAEVEVSMTAGSYVCNDLYYLTQNWLKTEHPASLALFLHIPSLPEQFPEEPHLSFERTLAIVSEIVQKMIQI